ncbi:MAG: DUF3641 domain-containing protein [Hymenobacter sp.]|nr:MAG: DUF3641 domain-containing protein [Hymenobacter sp.]
MKSLKATGHQLADSGFQLTVLSQGEAQAASLPRFRHKLAEAGLWPLRPVAPAVLQLNVGKMCNQVCRHCHVDAGPDRTEIMTRETMQLCLDALAASDIQTVDITGGAPEMNPDFRWLVEEIRRLGRHVLVRCNLTIIVANKKYYDLPEFYRQHGVEVISSLPYYSADKTDRQRGQGVFADSIRALQMLNAVGYGQEGSGFTLNLVYNPAGAFMPGAQAGLQQQFPAAAAGVMCRTTLSVGWDGQLYDCDFNQMLDLPVATAARHIRDFDPAALAARAIVVNEHCYGCTAGSGSSCGGTTA